jgi:DNA polymerase-3 subunit delta
VGKVAAGALYRWLERGGRGGTFLIQGDEDYLKEEAVGALIRHHLDPATRDFNLDQLRGQGLDPETLASIAQTPPMMSEWRVVVVRDSQYLASNARLRSVVEALTDREIPGLALVLATSTGDISKSKFQKSLERRAQTVTFATLPAADVPGWLMDRAAEAGVEMEPAAARTLAAASDAGLGVLVQELAKLVEFAGERRRIAKSDVTALVGAVPRQNRWDWFDLVGDAKFAEARAGLPILLDGSETGVGLLIGLGTHFLRLGVAVAGGEAALQAALPGHQRWLASRLKRQARKWSRNAIDGALADLLRADRLLKSASLRDRHVMDELLLRLQTAQAAA